jgi:hypothetical protein
MHGKRRIFGGKCPQASPNFDNYAIFYYRAGQAGVNNRRLMYVNFVTHFGIDGWGQNVRLAASVVRNHFFIKKVYYYGCQNCY